MPACIAATVDLSTPSPNTHHHSCHYYLGLGEQLEKAGETLFPSISGYTPKHYYQSSLPSGCSWLLGTFPGTCFPCLEQTGFPHTPTSQLRPPPLCGEPVTGLCTCCWQLCCCMVTLEGRREDTRELHLSGGGGLTFTPALERKRTPACAVRPRLSFL